MADGRRFTRYGACALLALGVFVAMLASASAAPTSTAPTVTFTLLSELPKHLAVGESAVIAVHVESSEPFAMAIALSDAYFPGRSVRFDGSSAHPNDTSADLYLTITATRPTADLPAAHDWPVAGIDWPAGIAPPAVRVGARFAGGQVVSDGWLFAVQVV